MMMVRDDQHAWAWCPRQSWLKQRCKSGSAAIRLA